MKTTKYMILAAAAMALAACSNDDEVTGGPVAAQVTAGVDGVQTRANNNVWGTDDIGVKVKGVSGTTTGITSVMADLYKNVKYSTTANTSDAATFTSNNGIFFQDANEEVTFTAYGPYQQSEANALPGTDGVVSSLSTETQSTRELQKKIDFIYASGATASRATPIVQFSGDHAFAHKMTRLIIIVKTSTADGFTADKVTSGTYTLSGLNHKGQFNVTTGEAEATGTELTTDWSLTENSLMTGGETTQCTFTSILYPQTLNDALVFKAVIDGQTYTNNNEIKPALEAGTSYTYEITVKKTGLEVSGCTIKDWNSGNAIPGDATMQ